MFNKKQKNETSDVKVIMDEIDLTDETDVRLENNEHLTIPTGVEVYEINGPYFFGIASKLDDIMATMEKRPKGRIIRMRRVPFIDSTGIHNLQNLCQMSHREGTHIVLSGVQEKAYDGHEHNGVCPLRGKVHICPNIYVALKKAEEIAHRG